MAFTLGLRWYIGQGLRLDLDLGTIIVSVYRSYHLDAMLLSSYDIIYKDYARREVKSREENSLISGFLHPTSMILFIFTFYQKNHVIYLINIFLLLFRTDVRSDYFNSHYIQHVKHSQLFNLFHFHFHFILFNN